MFMTSPHSLQLYLHSVPIGFYILSVYPSCWCHKCHWMIDCGMWGHIGKWANLAVSRPLIWPHGRAWKDIVLNNGQKCNSISFGNNLHKSQSWLLGCIHHSKYPSFWLWRTPTMVLYNIKKINWSNTSIRLSTFDLWRKRDSSIWTIFSGPPSLIVVCNSLVVHTSRNHWYTFTAVSRPTPTDILCCSYRSLLRVVDSSAVNMWQYHLCHQR